jgi:hypothetical protein
MSTAGEEILKSFDLLPEREKHEVAKQILQRSPKWRSVPLTDEELTLSAEELFLELDRRESDGQSRTG